MKNKLEKKIKKQIDKYCPCYKDYEEKTHHYDYTIETHEGIFYIKFFYKGVIPYSNVEILYSKAIGLFDKLGYGFQGITEYRDNNEICLTFLKNN